MYCDLSLQFNSVFLFFFWKNMFLPLCSIFNSKQSVVFVKQFNFNFRLLLSRLISCDFGICDTCLEYCTCVVMVGCCSCTCCTDYDNFELLCALGCWRRIKQIDRLILNFFFFTFTLNKTANLKRGHEKVSRHNSLLCFSVKLPFF